MKLKFFFTCFFTFSLVGNASAQIIKYYTFQKDSVPYTPFTGGTSAIDSTEWFSPNIKAPIGFNFRFFTDLGDTLYGDPFINAAAILAVKPFSLTSFNYSAFAATTADLRSAGGGPNLSPITYQTVGTSPNRIFKLQYQNARFEADSTSVMDFQVWLHENTMAIETHYGPSTFNVPSNQLYQPEYGPGMVLIDRLNLITFTPQRSYYIYGSEDSPSQDSLFTAISSPSDFPGVDGQPLSGWVYRFIPNDKIAWPANIIDQPFKDAIIVSYDGNRCMLHNKYGESLQLNVFDVQGKSLHQQNITEGINIIPMQMFANGVNILQLSNQSGKQTYRIIR